MLFRAKKGVASFKKKKQVKHNDLLEVFCGKSYSLAKKMYIILFCNIIFHKVCYSFRVIYILAHHKLYNYEHSMV